jgi:hypothetical protein
MGKVSDVDNEIYIIPQEAYENLPEGVTNSDEWLSSLTPQELGRLQNLTKVILDNQINENNLETLYEIASFAIFLYCLDLDITSLPINDDFFYNLSYRFSILINAEVLRRTNNLEAPDGLFLYKDCKYIKKYEYVNKK